jgi:hypothetical protein
LNTTSFYKFRGITNWDNLSEDFSLDALFKSYAIFSGRKNFNDLFDSKIYLEYPKPHLFLSLLQHPRVDRKKKYIMDSWVLDEKFTPDGIRFFETLETTLNEMIDTYPIYSVSSHCTCNLLWAHYAASHKGFCIEFDFDGNEQPQKVTYQKDIASISILDLLKYDLGLDTSDELGVKIMNALLVKLEEWQYEREHRWIASNTMGQVPKGETFIKLKYDPRKVKSIIFGCRMIPDVKKYIIKNIPFTAVFKQAIETKNCIEIIDFDDKKPLH